MRIQKPVFICGCHKSGTSLLRSLFDGTPGVFALPLETHFFQMAKYLINYPYRATVPAELTPDRLLARIVDSVAQANAHTDSQSYGVLSGRVDIEVFSQALRDGVSPRRVDAEEYFTAFVCALHRAVLGCELPQTVSVIEKSVENAEVAPYWLNAFPTASFVHIIRNPYANLVSLRKYKTTRKQFPYLRKPVEALASSFDYAYRNRVSMPRYFVVRYEDLVVDAEAEMRRLCSDLGLVYDAGMSRPTFLGTPWRGNSTTGRALQGVSTSRVDAWESNITSLEVSMVNRRLEHVLRDFDYPLKQETGSPWKPIWGESASVYLRNRILYTDVRSRTM